MRFNLISNLANGVGLERDYKLLREDLEALGHSVAGVQFNARENAPEADTNIFLEVIEPRFFRAASIQWAVPNPEWWFEGWFSMLPRFKRLLCKTPHAFELFSGKTAAQNCRLVGWRSRDLLDDSIPRRPVFFHLAGQSHTKNTEAVLECWRRFTPAAELVVVANFNLPRVQGVTHFRRVAEDQLREMMNAAQFHLLPSAYEGWGHALHEALGVGAVVLTTDAEPMRDWGAPELLIPTSGSAKHHAVQIHRVSPEAVWEAVRLALQLPAPRITELRARARAQFEAEGASFRAAIARLCPKPA